MFDDIWAHYTTWLSMLCSVRSDPTQIPTWRPVATGCDRCALQTLTIAVSLVTFLLGLSEGQGGAFVVDVQATFKQPDGAPMEFDHQYATEVLETVLHGVLSPLGHLEAQVSGASISGDVTRNARVRAVVLPAGEAPDFTTDNIEALLDQCADRLREVVLGSTVPCCRTKKTREQLNSVSLSRWGSTKQED